MSDIDWAERAKMLEDMDTIDKLVTEIERLQALHLERTKTTHKALTERDAEIERLTALTKADAKEIGSYRDKTGLRGEIMNKDAELGAADEKIEHLQARVEALEGVVRDAHYEGYMAGVGDSEDYDHDPTVMEKEAWAEYEETDDE